MNSVHLKESSKIVVLVKKSRTQNKVIMPDTYGLTNRPVVRKLSATSDLFKKFDRRDSTGDSAGSLSSSGTTTPLLRSRQGSIKKVRSKAEVSSILSLCSSSDLLLNVLGLVLP